MIEFDISELERMLGQAKEGILRAARTGAHDATDSLLATSRDIAPLDEGPLRMTAGKRVEVGDNTVEGEVYYSAVSEDENGERVNYALITHELHSGDGFSGIRYKNPTTPGTQPKYLERPLKQNAEKYRNMVADAVREELMRWGR